MAPDTGQRIAVIESQIGRLVSDVESEKETRARVHERLNNKDEKIEEKLGELEKMFARGLGALAAVELLVGLYAVFWKK